MFEQRKQELIVKREQTKKLVENIENVSEKSDLNYTR